MIRCPKCNALNESNVNFCENCGTRLVQPNDSQTTSANPQTAAWPTQPSNNQQYQTQQQYQNQPRYQQPQYQQPQYQQNNPNPNPYQYTQTQPQPNSQALIANAKSQLIKLGKSPLFLVTSILLTVCLVANLGSMIFSLIFSYTLFPARRVLQIIVSIISNILAILTLLSFWMIYSSSLSRDPGHSSAVTGLTIIKVLQIIKCVFICIVAGIMLIAGVFVMIAALIEEPEMLLGAFMLLIVGAIYLAVTIVFCRSICNNVNAAVNICRGAYPVPAGIAAAVMNIISAVFSLFSSLTVIFLAIAADYSIAGIFEEMYYELDIPAEILRYAFPSPTTMVTAIIAAAANILIGVILIRNSSICKSCGINAMYGYNI